MNLISLRLVCALLGIAAASTSFACGFCIEDKIAAVYDHALTARALASKHQVVFFAIEGDIPPGETSRRMLAMHAGTLPSVDQDSVRVSVESASLSVAVNPAHANLTELENALNRKLARRGLHAAVMRVIDKAGGLNAR